MTSFPFHFHVGHVIQKGAETWVNALRLFRRYSCRCSQICSDHAYLNFRYACFLARLLATWTTKKCHCVEVRDWPDHTASYILIMPALSPVRGEPSPTSHAETNPRRGFTNGNLTRAPPKLNTSAIIKTNIVSRAGSAKPRAPYRRSAANESAALADKKHLRTTQTDSRNEEHKLSAEHCETSSSVPQRRLF